MTKEPITKTDFAKRRGVTPARVSQWLAEGKIDSAAMVGTGRNALIDEDIACRQLEDRLALDQLKGNGRHTTLAMAIPIDADTSLEVGRIVARVIDSVMPELAKAIADEFQHQPNEVLKKLRETWRQIAAARQAAVGIRLGLRPGEAA
jgi:hypothetical protein